MALTRLSRGSFTLGNGPIIIPANYVSMEGEGRATVITQKDGANLAAMITSADNALESPTVRKLQINGNRAMNAVGTHGIQLRGMYAVVDSVWLLLLSGDGIRFVQNTGGTAIHGQVKGDTWITNITGDGIVSQITDTTIQHGLVIDAISGYGINCSASSISIKGRVSTTKAPYYFHGTVKNFDLECDVNGCAAEAIILDSTEGAGATDATTISGHIYGVIRSPSTGSNNTVDIIKVVCPLGLGDAVNAIRVGPLHVNTYEGTNRPRYFINVATAGGDVSAWHIDGCQVLGTRSIPMINGLTTPFIGDNTYWADAAYKSHNWGSATLASGTTTKVVAHGLDAAPTQVHIMPKEQGTADYGRYWVDTVDATNFTLNVSVDPGASNLDFYWDARV